MLLVMVFATATEEEPEPVANRNVERGNGNEPKHVSNHNKTLFASDMLALLRKKDNQLKNIKIMTNVRKGARNETNFLRSIACLFVCSNQLTTTMLEYLGTKQHVWDKDRQTTQ